MSSTIPVYLKHIINKDKNGNMYLLDYLDALYLIQISISNFRKTASSLVYGSFLTLANTADTGQMCTVSDSYVVYSQQLRNLKK